MSDPYRTPGNQKVSKVPRVLYFTKKCDAGPSEYRAVRIDSTARSAKPVWTIERKTADALGAPCWKNVCTVGEYSEESILRDLGPLPSILFAVLEQLA